MIVGSQTGAVPSNQNQLGQHITMAGPRLSTRTLSSAAITRCGASALEAFGQSLDRHRTNLYCTSGARMMPVFCGYCCPLFAVQGPFCPVSYVSNLCELASVFERCPPAAISRLAPTEETGCCCCSRKGPPLEDDMLTFLISLRLTMSRYSQRNSLLRLPVRCNPGAPNGAMGLVAQQGITHRRWIHDLVAPSAGSSLTKTETT